MGDGVIGWTAMAGLLVRSGRFRVSELDRDVELERILSDGSEGLWRMFPVLPKK